MKIFLLIQKPQLRGAELFACQLGNHLLVLGHEVIVISIFPGDAALPFNGTLIRLDRPIHKRLFDYTGWRAFAQLHDDHKPDIIQANAGDTLKFAAFTKLIWRIRTPLIFRNANKISDFIDSTPKRVFNKFFLSQADFVISVSELCREDFRKTFSWPDRRIKTIPIGIDVKAISTQPSDLKPIFSGGPVFIHIGSFVKEKNHEGLLRIFKRVLGFEPSAQLILIGKGPLESVIKKIIMDSDLGSNVHALGSRTDVLEILHHSTALLLPSLIEGLPGVILEAQYSRTAVVAFDVGGISEVVQHEHSGFLVPKGDEDFFVDCVRRLLNDFPLRRELVNNAYQQVTASYDNRQIAKRFLEVFTDMSRR